MATPTRIAPINETAAPVNAGARIGHVHLKVADINRALAFYCDVLGFELMQRLGAQAAFVSAGGYHHHIGLNTWESRGGAAPAPGTTGLYHLAILYPTRAALGAALRQDSARRRLRSRRQRGDLSARSGRQRRRALLGSAAGAVAAHRRRQARHVHAPARSDELARRGRRCAGRANRGAAVRAGARSINPRVLRPAPAHGSPAHARRRQARRRASR